MTSAGPTERTAAAMDAGRARARLRSASMGALTMLVIQYVLGVAVNLYINPAKGGAAQAFNNGPLLALHAVVGILLVLAALDLLVRAIIARHQPVITASAVGLLAILGAAFNGFAFLKTHANGSSLGMAIAAGVAILCYAFCLRVLGSPDHARD
jgi:cytochrome bd-type quinol oxidase subunit 2